MSNQERQRAKDGRVPVPTFKGVPDLSIGWKYEGVEPLYGKIIHGSSAQVRGHFIIPATNKEEDDKFRMWKRAPCIWVEDRVIVEGLCIRKEGIEQFRDSDIVKRMNAIDYENTKKLPRDQRTLLTDYEKLIYRGTRTLEKEYEAFPPKRMQTADPRVPVLDPSTEMDASALLKDLLGILKVFTLAPPQSEQERDLGNLKISMMKRRRRNAQGWREEFMALDRENRRSLHEDKETIKEIIAAGRRGESVELSGEKREVGIRLRLFTAALQASPPVTTCTADSVFETFKERYKDLYGHACICQFQYGVAWIMLEGPEPFPEEALDALFLFEQLKRDGKSEATIDMYNMEEGEWARKKGRVYDQLGIEPIEEPILTYDVVCYLVDTEIKPYYHERTIPGCCNIDIERVN